MVKVIHWWERRLKMAGILVEDVSFESEGYRLRGRVYHPSGEGRFPAVALCHGYPGDNKNMDLAEELALNGIAVLLFYYRGAWGSEGDFGLTHMASSARDALRCLRGLSYVDDARVGMVSHSMGALPLVSIMSRDTDVNAGVLMSPVSDLSAWSSPEALDAITPVFMKMAEGKLRGWTEARLRSGVVEAAKSVNPVDHVSSVRAPLLVVVGSMDNVTTPESCRLLYDAANEPKTWVEIEGADHSFTEHRIPLIEAVVDWLRVHL